MNKNVIFEIVDVHVKSRQGLLFWGETGVGKTASVKDYCQTKKINLLTINAVYLDPLNTTLPTVEMIATEGGQIKQVENTFHQWVNKLVNATEPTIMFFDELNRAPLQSVNMLTEMLLEHSINGQKLSPHVAFVSACNFSTQDGGVIDIQDAVINRFTNILLAPQADVRAANMRNKYASKAAKKHLGQLRNFNEANLIFKDEVMSRMRHTERSIDMLADILVINKEEGLRLSEPAKDHIAKGKLGEGYGPVWLKILEDEINNVQNTYLDHIKTEEDYDLAVEYANKGKIKEIINAMACDSSDKDLVMKFLIEGRRNEVARALIDGSNKTKGGGTEFEYKFKLNKDGSYPSLIENNIKNDIERTFIDSAFDCYGKDGVCWRIILYSLGIVGQQSSGK